MSTLVKSNDTYRKLSELTREISEDELTFYKTEGYVVIRNAIPRDVAEDLKREVDEIMEIVGLGKTKLRQTVQYLKGSGLDALVNSGYYRGIAETLLGGSCTLYMPFTAVKSGGGGGKFHYHQDNNYTRFTDGNLGINLWTALTPMRPENGALQVAPRTHRAGTVESDNAGDGDAHRKVVVDPEHFELLEMEPGDLVAFSRLTIHGSGPNETDENRVAYAVQFHRDDVVATIDGEEVLLKDHPRYKDIYGVPKITDENAGSRDGH